MLQVEEHKNPPTFRTYTTMNLNVYRFLSYANTKLMRTRSICKCKSNGQRAREEDKETMKTNWTKADEEFLTIYGGTQVGTDVK